MGLISSKKGFAFTLLALFLSFLVFAFGSLFLFQGDFTKDKEFKEARINFLDSELNYFKNNYMKDVMAFSLHNVFYVMLENHSLMTSLENNHSKLNQIIAEAMVNGSFYGTNNPYLDDKTITYFLTTYQQDFQDNFKGDINFRLLALNVYEERPYYVTLQVEALINLTTIDNISEWEFNEKLEVAIPTFELKDPEFFIHANQNYTVRPVELYSSNINWSLDLLNNTLIETYSSTYLEPNYRYSLGTSFLNRILNNSQGSYEDVLGFWSFDYDTTKYGVYDNALRHNLSKNVDNTLLLMTFDNRTILNGHTQVQDLSAYNNTGTINGDLNCSCVPVGT